MTLPMLPIGEAGPLADERQNAERQWLLTAQRRPDWLAVYRASMTSEERLPLFAALRAVAPFRTALDLGCNCGVLVPALEAASPGVAITGVDLAPVAIEAARREHGRHAWACAALLDWLPVAVGWKRYDLVVAASVLCTTTPPFLDAALDAVVRLADVVVLQEPVATPLLPEGRANSGMPEWRYDYAARFAARAWDGALVALQGTATGRPCAVWIFRKRPSTADSPAQEGA